MKMLKIIKHLFVPHENNNYTPHFFREFGVSVIIFTSVFLLGASFGSSFFLHRTVLGAQISSNVLIDLTNENRIAYNQPALVRNEKLDMAAELKGKDMAEKQYFSHDSPDGITPWYWMQKVGYNFLYAGENLAIDFTEAVDVEKAWLESPAHKANIMNVDFREIGIAVVEGMYKGYPTMYIVQMFGTPAHDGAKLSMESDAKEEIKSGASTASRDDLSTDKASTHEGSVAGSSTTVPSIEKSKNTDSLKHVILTQNVAVVENILVHDSKKTTLVESVKYSSWYERLLFDSPRYVDVIYKILLTFIALGLVTLITVEIRKQHPKHILYGVLALLLLSLFAYINQSYIFLV